MSTRLDQDQWIADQLDAFETEKSVRILQSAVHFSKASLLAKGYALIADQDFGDGRVYLGVKAEAKEPSNA